MRPIDWDAAGYRNLLRQHGQLGQDAPTQGQTDLIRDWPAEAAEGKSDDEEIVINALASWQQPRSRKLSLPAPVAWPTSTRVRVGQGDVA